MDEGHTVAEDLSPTAREVALILRAPTEVSGVVPGSDLETLVVGTTSIDPSPSLNLFTNIFNIFGMDWMGNKLKHLSLSPLPLDSSIPLSAAHDETTFPPLPLVTTSHSFESIDEEVSPSSPVHALNANRPLSSHS